MLIAVTNPIDKKWRSLNLEVRRDSAVAVLGIGFLRRWHYLLRKRYGKGRPFLSGRSGLWRRASPNRLSVGVTFFANI